jgi:SH3-like domain-containing protein
VTIFASGIVLILRAAWFVLVFAVIAPGIAHAVTRADPNFLPPTDRQLHGRDVRRRQEEAEPRNHSGRREVHRPGERPARTLSGKPPRPRLPDARGLVPPVRDQKVPAPVVLPAPSTPPEPPSKDTGEPPAKIPRFAALKTDDTNMRKGPGQRYPIEWVYKRRDLPVEVEREYDVWRYVRDPDGVEGWVHQVTLSDRRTFMVQDKDAILRADPNDTASPVASLKVGVIGRLRVCDAGSKWCQVQVGGYKGYLRRDQFWGLLPDEVVSPS